MENSSKRSEVVDISTRNRLLDLKSLYESEASTVRGFKKGAPGKGDHEDAKKKRKMKTSKEFPLSCFQSDAKKTRKGDVDGLKLQHEFGQTSSVKNQGLHGISLVFAGNGGAFVIPKRPRGSMGRRKSKLVRDPLKISNSSSQVEPSETKVLETEEDARPDENVDKISCANSGFSNSEVKANIGAHEITEQIDILPPSTPRNDGDESPKMQPSKSKKKKDFVIVRDSDEASGKKFEPLAGSSTSNDHSTNDDDDDEENLEKNAAKMLSSRFDPNFTGFSSKRRHSAPRKGGRSSFHSALAQKVANADCADDKGRAMRPRGDDNDKGAIRRRRHFYEILPGDLDPYRVMNQRIKIYWPLDESWYFGRVDDYHSETRLHHIKYDDRDEEWVNLLEEKFKILLLPSEAPIGSRSRKRAIKDSDTKIHKMSKHRGSISSTKNCNDSLPIASWLKTQHRRGKAMSKTLKKQKISEEHHSFEALPTSRNADDSNAHSAGKKRTRNQLKLESRHDEDLRNRETDGEPLTTQNCSLSRRNVVYVRKRYRNKCLGDGFIPGNVKGRASVRTLTLANILDSWMTSEEVRTYGCVNSDIPLWYFDECGLLRLSHAFVKFNVLRFQIHLPVLPLVWSSSEFGFSWMAHDIFMLRHGKIVTTSPHVLMQILFLDSHLGLKFLLYEGSLRQALAVVSLILTVFSQSKELCNDGMRLPEMSMRFRLCSGQDLRKKHDFGFYCSSKLQRAERLYLDCEILQQCLLVKRLSVSECTYEKMKELEYGKTEDCNKPPAEVVLASYTHSGLARKLMQGILPTGISQKAVNSATNLHSTEPGKSPPQFALPFTLEPTFFHRLHSQFLLDSSFAWLNLRHQDSERVVDPVSENAAVEREAPKNLVGLTKSLKRGRTGSVLSPPLRYRSPFSNGPAKRRRTQVQYSLPIDDYDFVSMRKLSGSRSLPYKRIRRANLKRISDGQGNDEKSSDPLTCFANILVTQGVKGWREHGAKVVLEVADHNEWRLAVKLSGITKFSYKVKHVLQPGSTNRFLHRMMWKGGNDWMLEFPDRNQWTFFKDMHEECYNRNIRAASVKNIPIPGVQLVEERSHEERSRTDDNTPPFVRNSPRYIQQVGSDVEMALDPLRNLYDMDSDDEKWLLSEHGNNHPAADDQHQIISEEYLEKAMNMFEKFSYAEGRENFTDSEFEGRFTELGPVEAGKAVYEHWKKKREKMGMPLIRHLQPPLWERYQQQLNEWERKVFAEEKPPMFAFCLKPRGLEVPNRGLKQRSHRKLPVSSPANHDGFHVLGRRSNGGMPVFYSPFASRLSSSRDEEPDWKTTGLAGRRSGGGRRDVYEFRVRDASGAARNARATAEMKRRRAHGLFRRADLAVHRAAVALMAAEALKRTETTTK